jgi:hypothetical protein
MGKKCWDNSVGSFADLLEVGEEIIKVTKGTFLSALVKSDGTLSKRKLVPLELYGAGLCNTQCPWQPGCNLASKFSSNQSKRKI